MGGWHSRGPLRVGAPLLLLSGTFWGQHWGVGREGSMVTKRQWCRIQAEKEPQLLGPWAGDWVAEALHEGSLRVCWKLCVAECRPCSPAQFHQPCHTFLPFTGKGKKGTWLMPHLSSLPMCPPKLEDACPCSSRRAPHGFCSGIYTGSYCVRLVAACGYPAQHPVVSRWTDWQTDGFWARSDCVPEAFATFAKILILCLVSPAKGPRRQSCHPAGWSSRSDGHGL